MTTENQKRINQKLNHLDLERCHGCGKNTDHKTGFCLPCRRERKIKNKNVTPEFSNLEKKNTKYDSFFVV